MPIVLTLTNTELTPVNPVPAGAAFVQYTTSAITNSKNRIGELKRIRLSFTSSVSVIGYKFFLNPGLFVNKSAPVSTVGMGTRFYYFQPIGLGLTTGSYNALGATFPNIDKLYSVYMIVLSTTTFDIYIEYYQSYDYEGFLEPNIGDNQSHFLKDKKSSTSQLTVSGSSIYNDTNVDFRNYLYVENVSVPTDNAQYDLNSMYGYKAGFYEKGNTNTAPYFNTPVLQLLRSSVAVTSLSSVQDTNVTFSISTPSLAVSYFVATIIRTDKTDNSVDFATNYELEQVCIDAASTPTSKIIPVLGSTLFLGKYICFFTIDKTTLVVGAKYRIIMHSYHNDFPTNYEVDAYISDELEVVADVPYAGDGFDVTARLRDVFHQYVNNNLLSTIEERLRSQIVLDFQDDYGVNTYFRDIYNRLGLTITDVSRYLTSITFTIYDVASTPGQKHVVDQRTAYRSAPSTYTIRGGGITVTFNAGDITIYADWRNRYEAGVLNDMTYNTTTGAAMGKLSNQYWGGRTFVVEWDLNFYYDDYVTPFTDHIVIKQQIEVRDYVSCLQIHAQNAPDENLEFWCPEDTMCLRAEFLCLGGGVSTAGYQLMTTIEPDPGSITTIQENESFVPLILPQQTTPLILSQENFFDTTLLNNAKFCVDVAALSLVNYKISAIAKEQ